jgi:sugar/nucleoside kinase (ribokinase family)
MLVADGRQVEQVPAFPVAGPVDPVGAGDATSAAITAALAAGATLLEAAAIASLAASITVQQLGTTGTASPAQIVRRYREASRGL